MNEPSPVLRLLDAIGCHFAEECDVPALGIGRDRVELSRSARDSNRPACVLIWREPSVVARALGLRDQLPIAVGLAVWEKSTRELLASTIALPRVFIAYQDLVAQPVPTVARLHRDLLAAGTVDLRLPSDDEIRTIIDPALPQHAGSDDASLNAHQCELRDALRSGAAQQWDVVPPLHSETNELLTAFSSLRREREEPAPPPVHHLPHLSWRERVWKMFVILGGRLLPGSAKRFVKKFWDPWRVPKRVRVPARKRREEMVPATTSTFDIVCFSIIDWSFRWQRPQQLLSQFADAGHRVFLFKTTAFLSHGPAKFAIEQLRENVWEVTIGPPMMIDVYSGTIDPATIEWFPSLLEKMRLELNIVTAVSLVQIATWATVAEEARRRFGWKVVYDCMDEWNSFPGMKPELLETEERLVAKADLVTVSARRLLEKWQNSNSHVELIRNAADYAHFSAPRSEHLLDAVRRPIIGYFGAIAAWFDVDLLARIASQRPDFSFVVIGGVFDVDVTPLERLPNVYLLGQQPYARMPAYLHDFDVCMIPFVVNEITAATDPVKFYEYISLGKPVVSTWMPELDPFGDLLYLAANEDDFLLMLDLAADERDESLRARRVEAAQANTWPVRSARMLRAIADVHPRVSVIIVSYNNLELTGACIDSVLRNSLHPNLEIIVVDNASKDGSAEILEAMRDERVHVLLNDHNAGFAAANNQALRESTGAYVVLLNNDTVVPRGWLPRMLRHLDDPQIGLTVAVTNFSGNESRISVPYETLDEMPSFAEEYMREHEGERFDIRVAAMYCVGMRREVFDRIGPLDEEFTIGMFEDDDYSHRVRLAGLRVICAEDVFVHHVGQASFSKLHPDAYEALWKRNQAWFEKKWEMRWEPHRLR